MSASEDNNENYSNVDDLLRGVHSEPDPAEESKPKAKAKSKSKAKPNKSGPSPKPKPEPKSKKSKTNNNDQEKQKEKESRINVYSAAHTIYSNNQIFKDQHNTCYAFVNIPSDNHSEVLFLDSSRFERWVYRKMILEIREQDDDGNVDTRTILPMKTDVETALSFLKSMAEFDAKINPLHLRVAGGINEGV
jgi:hypothetical protein